MSAPTEIKDNNGNVIQRVASEPDDFGGTQTVTETMSYDASGHLVTKVVQTEIVDAQSVLLSLGVMTTDYDPLTQAVVGESGYVENYLAEDGSVQTRTETQTSTQATTSGYTLSSLIKTLDGSAQIVANKTITQNYSFAAQPSDGQEIEENLTYDESGHLIERAVIKTVYGADHEVVTREFVNTQYDADTGFAQADQKSNEIWEAGSVVQLSTVNGVYSYVTDRSVYDVVQSSYVANTRSVDIFGVTVNEGSLEEDYGPDGTLLSKQVMLSTPEYADDGGVVSSKVVTTAYDGLLRITSVQENQLDAQGVLQQDSSLQMAYQNTDSALPRWRNYEENIWQDGSIILTWRTDDTPGVDPDQFTGQYTYDGGGYTLSTRLKLLDDLGNVLGEGSLNQQFIPSPDQSGFFLPSTGHSSRTRNIVDDSGLLQQTLEDSEDYDVLGRVSDRDQVIKTFDTTLNDGTLLAQTETLTTLQYAADSGVVVQSESDTRSYDPSLKLLSSDLLTTQYDGSGLLLNENRKVLAFSPETGLPLTQTEWLTSYDVSGLAYESSYSEGSYSFDSNGDYTLTSNISAQTVTDEGMTQTTISRIQGYLADDTPVAGQELSDVSVSDVAGVLLSTRHESVVYDDAHQLVSKDLTTRDLAGDGTVTNSVEVVLTQTWTEAGVLAQAVTETVTLDGADNVVSVIHDVADFDALSGLPVSHEIVNESYDPATGLIATQTTELTNYQDGIALTEKHTDETWVRNEDGSFQLLSLSTTVDPLTDLSAPLETTHITQNYAADETLLDGFKTEVRNDFTDTGALIGRNTVTSAWDIHHDLLSEVSVNQVYDTLTGYLLSSNKVDQHYLSGQAGSRTTSTSSFVYDASGAVMDSAESVINEAGVEVRKVTLNTVFDVSLHPITTTGLTETFDEVTGELLSQTEEDAQYLSDADGYQYISTATTSNAQGTVIGTATESRHFEYVLDDKGLPQFDEYHTALVVAGEGSDTQDVTVVDNLQRVTEHRVITTETNALGQVTMIREVVDAYNPESTSGQPESTVETVTHQTWGEESGVLLESVVGINSFDGSGRLLRTDTQTSTYDEADGSLLRQARVIETIDESTGLPSLREETVDTYEGGELQSSYSAQGSYQYDDAGSALTMDGVTVDALGRTIGTRNEIERFDVNGKPGAGQIIDTRLTLDDETGAVIQEETVTSVLNDSHLLETKETISRSYDAESGAVTLIVSRLDQYVRDVSGLLVRLDTTGQTVDGSGVLQSDLMVVTDYDVASGQLLRVDQVVHSYDATTGLVVGEVRDVTEYRDGEAATLEHTEAGLVWDETGHDYTATITLTDAADDGTHPLSVETVQQRYDAEGLETSGKTTLVVNQWNEAQELVGRDTTATVYDAQHALVSEVVKKDLFAGQDKWLSRQVWGQRFTDGILSSQSNETSSWIYDEDGHLLQTVVQTDAVNAAGLLVGSIVVWSDFDSATGDLSSKRTETRVFDEVTGELLSQTEEDAQYLSDADGYQYISTATTSNAQGTVIGTATASRHFDYVLDDKGLPQFDEYHEPLVVAGEGSDTQDVTVVDNLQRVTEHRVITTETNALGQVTLIREVVDAYNPESTSGQPESTVETVTHQTWGEESGVLLESVVGINSFDGSGRLLRTDTQTSTYDEADGSLLRQARVIETIDESTGLPSLREETVDTYESGELQSSYSAQGSYQYDDAGSALTMDGVTVDALGRTIGTRNEIERFDVNGKPGAGQIIETRLTLDDETGAVIQEETVTSVLNDSHLLETKETISRSYDVESGAVTLIVSKLDQYVRDASGLVVRVDTTGQTVDGSGVLQSDLTVVTDYDVASGQLLWVDQVVHSYDATTGLVVGEVHDVTEYRDGEAVTLEHTEGSLVWDETGHDYTATITLTDAADDGTHPLSVETVQQRYDANDEATTGQSTLVTNDWNESGVLVGRETLLTQYDENHAVILSQSQQDVFDEAGLQLSQQFWSESFTEDALTTSSSFVSTWIYDEQGRLDRIEGEGSTLDELQRAGTWQQISSLYDPLTGGKVSETKVVETLDPETGLTISRTEDQAEYQGGDLLTSRHTDTIMLWDEAGRTEDSSSQTLDAAGNVIETATLHQRYLADEQPAEGRSVEQTTTYDEAGKPLTDWLLTEAWNAAHGLVRRETLQRQYDPENGLIISEHGLTESFDENTGAAKISQSVVTSIAYDAEGWIRSSTLTSLDGSGQLVAEEQVSIRYNSKGEIQTEDRVLTDYEQGVASHERTTHLDYVWGESSYEGKGQITDTDLPAGNVTGIILETRSFDKDGKLQSLLRDIQDGNGQRLNLLRETNDNAEALAADHVPEGRAFIAGVLKQNETAEVSISLSDADGVGALSYQWQADGADISGATSPRLLLDQSVVGKTLDVVVSYTDGQGTLVTLTSPVTEVVANVDDAATGRAELTGDPKEGQVLSASAVNVVDVDGAIVSSSYQWQQNTGSLNSPNWVAIAGAIGSTFSVPVGQGYAGSYVRAIVTTQDALGGKTSFQSAPDRIQAENSQNTQPTGTVTITGSALQGSVLLATTDLQDADGLGALAYQWYAGNTAIANATKSSYTVTSADVGEALTVEVYYTDGKGTLEQVFSDPTPVVLETQRGVVADGYLSGALVYADANDNRQRDWADTNGNSIWDIGEGESWVLTDATGQYSGLVGTGTLRVVANPDGGTLDISTGKAFNGSFSAPSGSTVVNPLTTLVTIALASGKTEADVKAALGIGAGVDLKNYDPLKEAALADSGTAASAEALKLQGIATQVANLISVVTQLASSAGATGEASATAVANSVAGSLLSSAASGGTIDLTSREVLSTAIRNAATAVVVDSSRRDAIAAQADAIASSTAVVNREISQVTQTAGSSSALDVLTQVVAAQIVAQVTLAQQAVEAVSTGDVSVLTVTEDTVQTLVAEAVGEVQTDQLFVNHPHTGTVTVEGNFVLGGVLTAVSGLEDSDGVGAADYQWYRGSQAIEGATASTYRTGVQDLGQLISVKVSYVDGLGQTESESGTAMEGIQSQPVPTLAVVPVKGKMFGTDEADVLDTTARSSYGVKFYGGKGDDSYLVKSSGAGVVELADGGVDTVYSSASYYRLGKHVENLVMTGEKNMMGVGNTQNNLMMGNAGASRLDGGSGDDNLQGGSGNDVLLGGTGHDVLEGGVGVDRLKGGTGSDVFRYTSAEDALVSGRMKEVILDFSHLQGDKIDLSALNAILVADGGQAYHWSEQPLSEDADNTGVLYFNARTHTLTGSSNADATPELVIVLTGVKSLVEEDLIF